MLEFIYILGISIILIKIIEFIFDFISGMITYLFSPDKIENKRKWEFLFPIFFDRKTRLKRSGKPDIILVENKFNTKVKADWIGWMKTTEGKNELNKLNEFAKKHIK